MTQIGGMFVRLRPSLSDEDRAALEELGRNARALADGVDTFLGNFAREPEPDAPRLRLERET